MKFLLDSLLTGTFECCIALQIICCWCLFYTEWIGWFIDLVVSTISYFQFISFTAYKQVLIGLQVLNKFFTYCQWPFYGMLFGSYKIFLLFILKCNLFLLIILQVSLDIYALCRFCSTSTSTSLNTKLGVT